MNSDFSESNSPLYHLLTYSHYKLVRLIAYRLKHDHPDLKLASGQPRILCYLNNHKGAYQRQIADGCLLEPSTLSLILRKMEQEGVIRRGQQGKNRKNSVVTLTEKGRRAAECVEQVVSNAEREVLAECSAKERQILSTVLSRICAQEDLILDELDQDY